MVMDRRKFRDPEGLEVAGTGMTFQSADGHGQMPDKVMGEHRWVVTTMYTVRDPERVITGSIPLDMENIIMAALGCVDCERVYDTAKGTKCHAGDEWS